MHEARARNPAIRLYALEWAVPGWVISPQNLTGNSYVPANRRYTLDWLRGAKERWNISAVDYLGFWNEPDDNQFAPVSYIKALRGDLDRAGWAQTKLVALDQDSGHAYLYVNAMANDTALQRAVHAFGFHGTPARVVTPRAGHEPWVEGYLALDPRTRPRLWASEDGNLPASMGGARAWGRIASGNWLALNVTALVRRGAEP
jgi:hypothetical protein